MCIQLTMQQFMLLLAIVAGLRVANTRPRDR